jgi:hypothetical protein
MMLSSQEIFAAATTKRAGSPDGGHRIASVNGAGIGEEPPTSNIGKYPSELLLVKDQDQPPERSQHDLRLAPMCKHLFRPHQRLCGGRVHSPFILIRELWCFIACKTDHTHGEIHADLVLLIPFPSSRKR